MDYEAKTIYSFVSTVLAPPLYAYGKAQQSGLHSLSQHSQLSHHKLCDILRMRRHCALFHYHSNIAQFKFQVGLLLCSIMYDVGTMSGDYYRRQFHPEREMNTKSCSHNDNEQFRQSTNQPVFLFTFSINNNAICSDSIVWDKNFYCISIRTKHYHYKSFWFYFKTNEKSNY